MARFANCNDFPIIIQNPRGGSEYMRPGEFRDGDWWSRFVQPPSRKSPPGQLTKVADDYTPTRDFIPRIDKSKVDQLRAPLVVPAAGSPGAPMSGCSTGCEVSCEISCEASEQAIVVHEHYEQVGPEFYCRHCDWSTQDESHVDAHMQSYHQEHLGGPAAAKPGAVKGEGHGSAQPKAKDPGLPGMSGTVPAQDSPSSGPDRQGKPKSPESNEYWELREDHQYHCRKCRFDWSTTNKGAMARHAKAQHGYEREAAVVG